MKEGTDLDRLLQRRDGLVAAQEALLGHASFGTARRRASVDPPAGDAAAANAGPRFQHRLAHPPTPPMLAAQLKALVERELGLPVLRVVGEADPVLAWGVAAPGSPFAAVLSRDSDFLVYAGGRLLPFDLLDMRAMTVRPRPTCHMNGRRPSTPTPTSTHIRTGPRAVWRGRGALPGAALPNAAPGRGDAGGQRRHEPPPAAAPAAALPLALRRRAHSGRRRPLCAPAPAAAAAPAGEPAARLSVGARARVAGPGLGGHRGERAEEVD